ncbi:hypothetical protein HYH03_006503 [Edaphochlamys debaryana]|uniref:RWP-RK domain-containing protein n=1 Tax=Edaphochlamys debaryana TaxID=47281 RepID=A0A835YCZ1_9CHLO|nr:hypothetical protein HYH03_006503 [Edaphochlamys debaryana]|eukprot:KAG2495229.1 hypothetical protein HYH03_006503 [Edaphochlamys debaryana]
MAAVPLELASILEDFHPTDGKVQALEPVGQDQLPLARELSNADSLKLGELFSAGSLSAVEAALGVVAGPGSEVIAQGAPRSSSGAEQHAHDAMAAKPFSFLDPAGQAQPSFHSLSSPIDEDGAPQPSAPARGYSCDASAAAAQLTAAGDNGPATATASAAASERSAGSGGRHGSGSGPASGASGGPGPGDAGGGGGSSGGPAAADGSRPGRKGREAEEADIARVVDAAMDANYNQGVVPTVAFDGPYGGPRTTGRLIATTSAAMFRKGVAASSAGATLPKTLDLALRAQIEKHAANLSGTNHVGPLDKDRRTAFLMEAYLQISEELARSGVDIAAAAATAAAAASSPSASPNRASASAAVASAFAAAAAAAPGGGGMVDPPLLQQVLDAAAISHDGMYGAGGAAGGVGGTDILLEALAAFSSGAADGGVHALQDFTHAAAAAAASAAAAAAAAAAAGLTFPVPYNRTTGSVTMLDAWVDDTDVTSPAKPLPGAAAGGSAATAATSGGGAAPAPSTSANGTSSSSDVSNGAWQGTAAATVASASAVSAAPAAAAPLTPAAPLPLLSPTPQRPGVFSPFGAAGACDSPPPIEGHLGPDAPCNRGGMGVSPRPSNVVTGGTSPLRLSNAMSILRAGSMGGYMDIMTSNDFFMDDLHLDGRLPSLADKLLMSIDVLQPSLSARPSADKGPNGQQPGSAAAMRTTDNQIDSRAPPGLTSGADGRIPSPAEVLAAVAAGNVNDLRMAVDFETMMRQQISAPAVMISNAVPNAHGGAAVPNSHPHPHPQPPTAFQTNPNGFISSSQHHPFALHNGLVSPPYNPPAATSAAVQPSFNRNSSNQPSGPGLDGGPSMAQRFDALTKTAPTPPPHNGGGPNGTCVSVTGLTNGAAAINGPAAMAARPGGPMGLPPMGSGSISAGCSPSLADQYQHHQVMYRLAGQHPGIATGPAASLLGSSLPTAHGLSDWAGGGGGGGSASGDSISAPLVMLPERPRSMQQQAINGMMRSRTDASGPSVSMCPPRPFSTSSHGMMSMPQHAPHSPLGMIPTSQQAQHGVQFNHGAMQQPHGHSMHAMHLSGGSAHLVPMQQPLTANHHMQQGNGHVTHYHVGQGQVRVHIGAAGLHPGSMSGSRRARAETDLLGSSDCLEAAIAMAAANNGNGLNGNGHNGLPPLAGGEPGLSLARISTNPSAGAAAPPGHSHMPLTSFGSEPVGMNAAANRQLQRSISSSNSRGSAGRSPRGPATPRSRSRAAAGASLPSAAAVAAVMDEIGGAPSAAAATSSGDGGAVSGAAPTVAVAAAVAAGVVPAPDGTASADGTSAGADDSAGGGLRRSTRGTRANRAASSRGGRGRGRSREDDDEDYAAEDDDDASSEDEDDSSGGRRGLGPGGEDEEEEGFVDEDSVLVVRPVKDGPRREITKMALRKVYHLPINEAAAALNIGVTVLKKYCRKFRVPRWPYRKLQSMGKLIESFQKYKRAAIANADLEAAERCEVVIQSLHRFREEVYDNPDKDIDEGVKKLRQANFKIEYRQRQGQSGPGAAATAGSDILTGASGPMGSADLGRELAGLTVSPDGTILPALDGAGGAAAAGGGSGGGAPGVL